MRGTTADVEGFVPLRQSLFLGTGLLCTVFLCLGCDGALAAGASAEPTPVPPASTYPAAPRTSVTEEHHGVRVADPFRPLEDLNAPETLSWVAAENRVTDAYLAGIPALPALRARLAEVSSYERYGLPVHRGNRYFWTHNDGKLEQSVLVTAPQLDQDATVLVNPNVLSPDGKLAFVGYTVSNDGKRVAYGLSIGGGDWLKWRVQAVANAAATSVAEAEELEYIKYYKPSFSADGRGLFYSRFPVPAAGKEISETDHDCRVYHHALGTPTSSDAVVYSRPDHPSWQFEPIVTADGHYLVLEIGDGEVGDRNQELLVYLDLKKPGSKPVALVDVFEAEYLFLGNVGPVFYVVTSFDAPNKRIVAIDTRSPGRSAWRTVVPAGSDAIQHASLVGHQLFVTTLRDAHSATTSYDLAGKKLKEISLPGIGSVFGFEGGAADKATFYLFTSFTIPGSVYRYELSSGLSTPWRVPSVAFDASQFETVQFFYPGKDGTKVPLFLTSKKGLVRDGQTPTLLTAYGGGGWSWTPFFDPMVVPWLERGGATVVANIRGGGEYGEAWHQAAVGTRRQVAFNDFIAAAEWLVATKVTSVARLGIHGRSGGGLLVGAVLTQRPDLFGAAAPLAGVFDMLRFPLFGQGAGWEGEFGSPEDPADFAALYRYSPLHNVRPGTVYPATLVVTADHDVRVAPLHSYKFAAALQAAQAGPAPILLRVETQSGHGGGTTKSSRTAQNAELLGFFAQSLGMKTSSN